ncbi:thrombin inhibitor rhodniin-like [Drosophila montana]|uniref:thrombin inhibitor rhodniin-like n=1 Tax=Drosophila montana TaxID=40370 RepID=UPI00313C8B0D
MRFLALIAVCLLALFALTAAADQEEICACPRNLEQVCGTDGTTYPNPCELRCAAKRATRQGRSLAQARSGPC